MSLLSEYLNSDLTPESLNPTELHGFLSALLVGPKSLEDKELLFTILGEDHSFDKKFSENKILTKLLELKTEIENDLFQGTLLHLPCALASDQGEIDDSLKDWAYGFFEAHLLFEELWYQENEDAVAEMLLTIVICVDDIGGEDLDKLRKDESVLQNLIEQIPAALSDLYLFFNDDLKQK